MAEKKEKKLALGPASWQTDRFEPSVEGVGAITHAAEGTPVPADKVEEVKAQAKASGLTIKEVS